MPVFRSPAYISVVVVVVWRVLTVCYKCWMYKHVYYLISPGFVSAGIPEMVSGNSTPCDAPQSRSPQNIVPCVVYVDEDDDDPKDPPVNASTQHSTTSMMPMVWCCTIIIINNISFQCVRRMQ